MQSQASQRKAPLQQGSSLQQSKMKYEQLGVDFKTQGELAIGMGILSALQQQIQSSFDAIDAPSNIRPSAPLLARCIKCSEKNQELLLGVLRVKEQLIGRMYMGRQSNKANQTVLASLLTSIRSAKITIRDHLHELRIRKLALASRPRPFEEEPGMEEQDLHVLRSGLQVLQKETFQLWNELSSCSLPCKPPLSK